MEEMEGDESESSLLAQGLSSSAGASSFGKSSTRRASPTFAAHTFSSSRDYVLDVRWSPTNPALFASAYARGTVCLWNVNSESEAPIASLNLSDSAVNKIQWSSNGKKIAAGDSSGKVSILGVSSEYANAHDWTRLGETITRLKRIS